MKLLAIDTSTEMATVAIAVDKQIQSEEQMGIRQHAQLILPMVERLLISAGLTFSQLDGIVFGRGPGSFTGLRIACSVAKGLAYAQDLPLFPVSSLAAIAKDVYQKEAPDSNVLAMVDARMHQVYWACFSGLSYEVLEQVSNPMDIQLESDNPWILAGVGFESYVPQLPEAVRKLLIKQRTHYPKAQAMIELVQDGHVHAVSAADALPVYIRDKVTHTSIGGESVG